MRRTPPDFTPPACRPFFADGLLDVCTWMDFDSDDDAGDDLF